MKTITSGHIMIKLLKTRNEEKMEVVGAYHTTRNNDKDDCRFLVGNNASEKTVEQQHLKSLKGKMSTYNYIPCEKTK